MINGKIIDGITVYECSTYYLIVANLLHVLVYGWTQGVVLLGSFNYIQSHNR